MVMKLLKLVHDLAQFEKHRKSSLIMYKQAERVLQEIGQIARLRSCLLLERLKVTKDTT